MPDEAGGEYAIYPLKYGRGGSYPISESSRANSLVEWMNERYKEGYRLRDKQNIKGFVVMERGTTPAAP